MLWDQKVQWNLKSCKGAFQLKIERTHYREESVKDTSWNACDIEEIITEKAIVLLCQFLVSKKVINLKEIEIHVISP